MKEKIKVTSCPVGELQCNCYLIENEHEALLVDPGAELEKIIEFINNKQVIGILLTHHHFDHVGCVDDLVDRYQLPVYDASNLKEGKNAIGSFQFEVIKTFGHTMDSLTYYFKEAKIMFTGDFLFFDTIGRCDFPESSINAMKNSIEKIKEYPDNITIYPGHGQKTHLGREKTSNWYFQSKEW